MSTAAFLDNLQYSACTAQNEFQHSTLDELRVKHWHDPQPFCASTPAASNPFSFPVSQLSTAPALFPNVQQSTAWNPPAQTQQGFSFPQLQPVPQSAAPQSQFQFNFPKTTQSFTPSTHVAAPPANAETPATELPRITEADFRSPRARDAAANLEYNAVTAGPGLNDFTLDELRITHWMQQNSNTVPSVSPMFKPLLQGTETILVSNTARCLAIIAQLKRNGRIDAETKGRLKDLTLSSDKALLAAAEVAAIDGDMTDFLDTAMHRLHT
ncbi:hypothetical protein Pelo_1965 [Pelomyxa schiedti]|nr:hypothetical protein Pelo_1965 [Pelomyxa schiedti]